MTDSGGPSRIGGAGGIGGLLHTLGLDALGPRAAGHNTAAGGGADRPQSQPRGMRILPADYPLELLDRDAPRGTYLDILV